MAYCSTCNSRLWRGDGCRVCQLVAMTSEQVMATSWRRLVEKPQSVSWWLPGDPQYVQHLLQLASGEEVCCCGSDIDQHDYYDNHSPVSMTDNYRYHERKEITQVFNGIVPDSVAFRARMR